MLLRSLGARPPRIAVLRGTPGLGDLLCAVPSWRALRAALPLAHVTLVAQPLGAAVAARLPAYLDDHLPFPGFPGIPDAGHDVRATVRFLAAAQERHFDLVIQQHGDGRVTNVVARLIGGRNLAGFHAEGEPPPEDGTFVAYRSDEHEIRRHLRLMARLGAPPTGEHLELDVLEADHRAADALLAGVGRFAVLHPGAADVGRRWSAASYTEVGRALAAAGVELVVTGTRAEAGLAEDVATAIGPAARSVAGRTDLGGLAAVIDRAALVVSNDTGPAHLAVARDVPSVVAVVGAPNRAWLPVDDRRHPAVSAADGSPSPAAVVAVARRLLAVS